MTVNRNRPWKEVEHEVVRKMHAAGKTNVEIGIVLNRRDVEIKKAKQRLGLVMRPTHNGAPWTDAELDRLRDLYESGMSYAEMGELLGRPSGSIRAKREALALRRHQRNEENTSHSVPYGRPTASVLLGMAPLAPRNKHYLARSYTTAAFLISLLRAGHTPGQGEFSIPSENRPVPHCQLVGA